jgi:hypothetical protein
MRVSFSKMAGSGLQSHFSTRNRVTMRVAHYGRKFRVSHLDSVVISSFYGADLSWPVCLYLNSMGLGGLG